MLAITGSTGFVGSYIVPFLPHPQKRLIRRSDSSNHSSLEIEGDLSNPLSIKALVENADTLVHFAWSSTPWTSNQDISADIKQNLIPTMQLFETFAKENPRGHIVFASTGGNMYQADLNVSASEQDIPHPWSSYSINKLAAENYLKLFCKRYGIRATVMRISNPYGVILPSSRPNGLIGVVFAKLLNHESLNIIDSLTSVRDYLHLEDLSEAIQLIVKNPPALGDFRLFNISSGKGYNIQNILDLIENVTGKTITKNLNNAGCKPTWSVLSPDRIKQALNWTPKIDLKEGIEKMWHHLKHTSRIPV